MSGIKGQAKCILMKLTGRSLLDDCQLSFSEDGAPVLSCFIMDNKTKLAEKYVEYLYDGEKWVE